MLNILAYLWYTLWIIGGIYVFTQSLFFFELKLYLMETKYKIEFSGSQKAWSTDLELVRNYAEVLRKECLNIFNKSKIIVQVGNNKPEIFDLNEWLSDTSLTGK